MLKPPAGVDDVFAATQVRLMFIRMSLSTSVAKLRTSRGMRRRNN